MWRLFSVLTLCGIPLLRADVCGGLPASPPNDSDMWRPYESPSFQLSVKPGGSAFRITVRPLWQLNADGRAVVDTHAGDIEVVRCQDGEQLQVLPITADQPINFGATFHADDINFDGYLDFSVLTEFAAKFGSRSYWVYDPGSGLFVENELTRELSENCLGAAWHRGCWKAAHIGFDQNKREIRADYIPSFAACAPNGYSGDRYRVQDNRLILVHKEELTRDNCTLTYSDLIGGTMRVTRVLRFNRAPGINAADPSRKAPPSQSPDPQPPNSRELVASVGGDVLYEHALDDHQQGLFSNARERRQVGAGQFVLSDKVFVTGIRWYGYYTCNINPDGISPAFDVRFYPDKDGLPASQPIYSAGVEAHVARTTASVVPDPASGVDFQVYAYTVDLPGPLTIPAGQPMWISISAEPSTCEWLWDRGSSADSGISVSGISGNNGFSRWTQLKDSLAFALYGRKFGTDPR
jgi:hypothetical protein